MGISRDGKQTYTAQPEVVNAFHQMRDEASKSDVHLRVISGFRPPERQRELFREAQKRHGRRRGIRWLAPPGFSEHQTGWALDLADEKAAETDDDSSFESTIAFRWLRENAGRFGFELSFPPGNWQGVGYEPWHWRFVGTPEAWEAFHPGVIQWVWIWARSILAAIRWWLFP